MNRTNLRLRNALGAGVASFLALVGMAFWVTGSEYFWSIVSSLFFYFLGISLFAAIVGAFWIRLRWSLCAGVLCGLAGGTTILLLALSNI